MRYRLLLFNYIIDGGGLRQSLHATVRRYLTRIYGRSVFVGAIVTQSAHAFVESIAAQSTLFCFRSIIFEGIQEQCSTYEVYVLLLFLLLLL